MDVAPRKDYSIGGSIGGGIIQGNPMGTRTGYFNPFKIVKKGLKKVANVAKQVVKSPIGKAALIGLGGYMLGPSIGASFGKMGGFKGMLGSFAGKGAFGQAAGGAGYGSGSGLLGLLSKGKNALSGMSGISKLVGAGGYLDTLHLKVQPKKKQKV